MTQCWMWTWELVNLLQTCCSHVDNNDNMVSIWKEDYHQELEFKSLLVLYCSMYIIIRYILASCINTSSTMVLPSWLPIWHQLDLDYLTNLDQDLDADDLKQPAAASDHLDYLGRGLDQDQDQDNQQQQQQGFLRRRPSQPGRFSLPGKQIWDRLWISFSQDAGKCGYVDMDM